MDHQSDQNVLRPQPRRPGTFSLTPISTNTSSSNPSPDTPSEPVTPESRDPRSNNNVSIGGKAPVNDRSSSSDQGSKSATKPQKTRSILNLTSSTLFGIYSPTGYDADRDEPLTPWGTGAQTPARSTSVDAQSVKYTPLASTETFKEKAAIGRERRKERRKSIHQHRTYAGRRSAGAQYAALLGRTTLLFLFGVAYGEVVAHLHDTRNLAPVRVDRINRSSWQYLGFWGMAGVVLGCLLPWSDSLGRKTYDEQAETDDHPFTDEKESQDEIDAAWSDPAHARTSLGAEWNPIVRSVGAFIGIAFAIRKLPWQSTLQVSLTLALVNPVIWYLIDRTRTGFLISLSFGTLGAAALLGINPEWIPAPATAPPSVRASSSPSPWDMFGASKGQAGSNSTSGVDPELLLGLISYESVGVATWISSVLFCSCVFFGNIGRRLTFDRHSM